jgi:hypothetical protein
LPTPAGGERARRQEVSAQDGQQGRGRSRRAIRPDDGDLARRVGQEIDGQQASVMAIGRSPSTPACARRPRSATWRQRSSPVNTPRRSAFIRATEVPDGSAPS